MKLSAHFSLAELTASAKAAALGDDNTPTPAHMANLKVLAAGLEEVRRVCGGRPMTITSGYRNPRVNRAVGGVPTSAHALGLAADFFVPGLKTRAVAQMLAQAVRDDDIEVDQVIWEKSRNIVHVSFDPRARGQVLTQALGPGSPVVAGVVG